MLIGEEFNLKDIVSKRNQEILFYNPNGKIIYRIKNLINGKSYIGDTKYDLNWRLFGFIGHITRYQNRENSHLYNSMNKYGIENFSISIISDNPEDVEKTFIDKFDSYKNGYNNNPTGKGTGSIGETMIGRKSMVHPEHGLKYVKPEDIDFYISKGYEVRGEQSSNKNRTKVHLGDQMKYVREEDLEEFLESGWELGVSQGNEPPNLKGLKIIQKNGNYKRVPEESIEFYLAEGWSLGGWKSTLGKVRLRCPDGNKSIMVSPEEVKSFLSKGYTIFHYTDNDNSTKGKIAVNDGYTNKMIYPDELDKYLSLGYSKGSKPVNRESLKGRIRINDGNVEKTIKPSELETYLSSGWKQGNLYKRIIIHKGYTVKKVLPNELDQYLSQGWEMNKPFFKMRKGDKIITTRIVSKYWLDKGYSLIPYEEIENEDNFN